MPHKVGLVWYCYFNIAIYHYTLATKPRVYFRADGTVYKILLLVRYFLYAVHPAVNIYLAGTAAAHTAAIMLQVYTVFEANIQNRFAFCNGQFHRLVVFLLKVDFNSKNVHRLQK